MKDGNPSVYVGESSRSVQERASEHWGAARRGDKESHMVLVKDDIEEPRAIVLHPGKG